MSEDTASRPGATDDQRTDSETTETAQERDASLDELAAHNRELRERVEELEATLESIQDSLGAEATTAQTAEQDGPTDETAATPPLVTGGGQDCKVIGEFTSQSGIGVYGHNQATSGTATGVKGETDSSETGASAVRGSAMASTGEIYGVLGDTQSPAGNGVVGNASTGSPALIPGTVGVYGHTDRSSEDPNVTSAGYGVVGFADLPDNATGTAYGVAGSTTSSDDDSYGVYSLDDVAASDKLLAGGNATIDGDVVTNANGGRTSRLYFGGESTPHGRLVHDNTEDTFTLSTNAKSGDTFEVHMDLEQNQDGTTQRTAGPIAKGFIKSDGTIANAVNISSAAWNSGYYEIEIDGVDYATDDYVVQVTAQRAPTASPLAVKTNYDGLGNLTVSFENDEQSDFNLTVWDLPSGTVTT